MIGAEGMAEAPYSGPLRILGDHAWTWTDQESAKQADPGKFAANGVFTDNLAQAQREKDRGFIDSITSGNFHNQSAAGVETAFSAMLGRMAGRLGREVTWEESLQHGEHYELGIDMSQFYEMGFSQKTKALVQLDEFPFRGPAGSGKQVIQ